MAKFSSMIHGNRKGYSYQCPACECAHMVLTDGKDGKNSPNWNFNEDIDKPTISPSVRVRTGQGKVCHFFIKDGKIEYCSDCTHAMAGKSVDLPEW